MKISSRWTRANANELPGRAKIRLPMTRSKDAILHELAQAEALLRETDERRARARATIDANKWQPGLCLLKSGGKCTDCANQAFVPVSDQVVIDHLQGRHDFYVAKGSRLCENARAPFSVVNFSHVHAISEDL
jgi:hypothetical protein